MAVRFTDDLVPIDDPPFFAEFSAEEHHFSHATMDLARRVIGDAVDDAIATRGSIDENSDPRKLLDLMDWWNSLPTARHTMPWFRTGVETARCIHAIKQHCHVCHRKIKVNSTNEAACECTHNEQYKRAATIVIWDVQRLLSMERNHQMLYRHGRLLRRELLLLEFGTSSPAWTKVLNAKLCQYLGSSFLGSGAVRQDWDFDALDNAVSQMIAYVNLTTNQRPFATTPIGDDDDKGHGRRPVFARLHALDVADESKKRQVQHDLQAYLDTVRPHNDEPTALVWTPQPKVLHRALRAIEKYERGMECTLLALGVEKVCRRQQWNVDKNAIVSTVSAFLGPPEHYDEAYMLEWWNMPLLPYEYSSTSLDCTSRADVFLYPFVVG